MDAILKVNAAVNAGQMSVASATRLLAATLGVDETTAASYVETSQKPEPSIDAAGPNQQVG